MLIMKRKMKTICWIVFTAGSMVCLFYNFMSRPPVNDPKALTIYMICAAGAELSIRQLCFFWHSEIAAFVKGFRKDQKLRLTIESQPYPHRIYPGNTAILLIRKFAGSSVHSAMKSIFLMRRKSFCWNTLRRNDVIS